MEPSLRTARLAGLSYLLLGITSMCGLLGAPLVLGDAAALAPMIAAAGLRFRLAIVSDLLSIVIGIFLVLLLYQLLSPVNKKQAVLMVVLLLVSAPVSLVITLNDIAAQILLSGADFLSALGKPQLQALATVFLKVHTQGVFAVEIFWGLWLIPFGLLVYKSGFLPRILGVLLVIAGLAYVAHSLFSLLLPGHRYVVYETATMVARGAGELPIMFWLLIRGMNSNPSSGEPAGQASIEA